jgi:hypothetical protein
MKPKAGVDLNFSFQATKHGVVTIFRNGRAVSVLRGASAQQFLVKAGGAPFAAQQQLMARVTGDYKRGNERLATSHARASEASDA